MVPPPGPDRVAVSSQRHPPESLTVHPALLALQLNLQIFPGLGIGMSTVG